MPGLGGVPGKGSGASVWEVMAEGRGRPSGGCVGQRVCEAVCCVRGEGGCPMWDPPAV